MARYRNTVTGIVVSTERKLDPRMWQPVEKAKPARPERNPKVSEKPGE